MAVFNRVNGDSQALVNVGDDITKNANSQIISLGIATPIEAYRVEVLGNLQAELGGPNGSGVPGAVETILRTIAANATVLAYQVDAGTGAAGDLGAALSVIVERSGWTGNAAIQTAVRAAGTGGNAGAYGAVTVTNALVFDRGLKLSRQ